MSDTSTSTRPTAPKATFTRRLYTGDFHFDFIKHRSRWYIFSAIVLLISVLAVGFRGLNLGIEFEGGSVFQAPVQVTSTTIDDYARAAQNAGVADLEAQVRTVGDSTVRVQTRSLTTEEVVVVRGALAAEAGIPSDQVAYSLIGPSWGQQITQQALIALVVFVVLVGVLIWLYFREWKMSVAALVALLHDLVVTVGLYALVGFTVTPATVIAVLTILGYSLYDTVVVFDMVREQTHDIKNQSRTYSDAANAAINQVLVRSINTTIIAVLPVLAILVAALAVLGGEGPLADLGLAMLIGMVSGAYSSIFLATPLLAQLREREPAMARHRRSLEKNQRRARARVTTAVTNAGDFTAADVPLMVMPATGTFAVAEEPAVATGASAAEAPRAGEPPTGPTGRVQPHKAPRSSRRK